MSESPLRASIGRTLVRADRRRRLQANYLDALNASRVRIHRQKPKALGLKFGCGLPSMGHTVTSPLGFPANWEFKREDCSFAV